jgi:acyl-CoA hydrolase
MSSITLRFLVEPEDAAAAGVVPGGILMKWMDQAGQACASGWASGPCVTAYVSSIRFRRTVHRGDLVEVHARMAFTGSSNMNIAVELRSGPVTSGRTTSTAECLMVYLAVDEQGEPVRVNQWTPETPGEMALASTARAQYDNTRPAPLE